MPATSKLIKQVIGTPSIQFVPNDNIYFKKGPELSPYRVIVHDPSLSDISQHLFPLISQKRHFFETLKYIELDLCFQRVDKKEVNFINDLFPIFSSLPSLRFLDLSLHPSFSHEMEQKLDLLKLLSTPPDFAKNLTL